MLIALIYLIVAFMFYAYCVVHDLIKVGWSGGQKFPLNCLATHHMYATVGLFWLPYLIFMAYLYIRDFIQYLKG